MREFNLSTKQGQNIYNRGSHYEGVTLEQVYGRASHAKQQAWEQCYNEYLSTENHTSFSICSHNSFQFSVSWLGTKDGENIMRVETAQNSFLVWLNR